MKNLDVSALSGLAVLAAIAIGALLTVPDKAPEICTGVVGAVSGWMAHRYSSTGKPPADPGAGGEGGE